MTMSGKRATRPSRTYDTNPQSGLGMIAMVGVLIGVGVVFLSIFLFANAGTNRGTDTQDPQAGTEQQASTSNEPPFIRVPDNSLIYKNDTYKFSFAYPNSFSKLTDDTSPSGSAALTFKSESALASQKPVGTSGAVLTGKFGVYVYSKNDFKILVGDPNIYVAPTKTGNDITWKVVSTGSTTQDVSIGSSYPVKTQRSQTGIPVFNFALNKSTETYGRYVFESGDYYVIIALPVVRLPSGGALSASDLAAYNIIGANLGSTVRVQSTTTSTSTSTSTNDTNSGTTPQPN